MHSLATDMRQPLADFESQKLESARPVCPEITLLYLNVFGSFLEPGRTYGAIGTAWYYFMSFCFLGYFCFFIFYGVFELVYKYYDYLWVLYLTMLVKCIILRRSVFEIKLRLGSGQFAEAIDGTALVVGRAGKYFTFAVAANATAVLLYDIVWMVSYISPINILISVMFLLGTVVFTGYMSTIILFCLADARFAQKMLLDCVSKAQTGALTPSQYSEIQTKIDLIVRNSFWIYGAVLVFIIINTISAVALLFIYDRFTDEYSVLQLVVFIVYVLVVMWAVDAAFVLFIIPEIAEVNEIFTQLHVTLAESKFSDKDSEIARYDTLHLVVAKPARFLIAGFYLTRSAVKNRAIGVALTMLFFIARLIVLLVLQHN